MLRLCYFALLLSTGVLSLPAGAADSAPDAELTGVNEAIVRIERWINDADNNRSQLEKDLRSSTQQIKQLKADIASNEIDIGSHQTQLEGLLKDSERLREQKAEQQTLVARALRSAYMQGRDGSLKLLLNQEDPGTGSRMLRYVAAFNENRLEHIIAFQQLLDELETTTAEIDATSAALAARNDSLRHQLAELSAIQEERSRILVSLESQLNERRTELRQLIQDREHLESLLVEINEILIDIPPPEELMPFAEARGRLPWPTAGALASQFGDPYGDGNLQRQGVIISAAEGAPIRAIHPGRVVFSDWLRGSGFLVVIDHGQGYLSLYAHNQALAKQTGDWASRGEIIATAGSNVGTGASGVYFEIRHNSQTQDPEAWCAAR